MSKHSVSQDTKSETIEPNYPILVNSSTLGKKGSLRILLVDNDVSFLQLSKLTLEKENNFEVETATSVVEAFQKLGTKNYDVIVSDYELPNRNGLDFLKDIREQKNNVSFVIFACKCSEEIAVTALNLGADDFLSKQGSSETIYCQLIFALKKIAERKEKRLLDTSDSKYSTLVEKSLQGIMIVQGAPIRVAFANVSMGKMIGYDPTEILALSPIQISELVYQEDRVVFFNRFKNRLAGKEAEDNYEFRAVHKNGSVLWMQAFSTLIEYEGKPAVQAMFLDVNERKKAEDELKRSEGRYRELANFLPEIIFESDLSGKITFFNQSAFEITGYAPEELGKGLNILQFIVPEEQGKAKENIKLSLAGEKHGASEYTLLRKNGTTFPGYVRTAPVISENQVRGLRGLVMDITEIKQMENTLAEYSEHLEQIIETRTKELKETQQQLVKTERLAAIGELAGMVGHDLRNPLASIKNATYYMKKKGAAISEDQAKEMLEIIGKAIDHSDKIINDLLEYAREIRLELDETSTRKLLTKALEMLQVPQSIKILDNTSDEPKISVDLDKMVRVFVNLIKNAIDAMPNGGSLEIRSSQSGPNIEISFADTGVGITDEVLPKIFSPLFTTKAQGMGFGLAICRRVVSAHGGKMSVETAVGKGTTFTVVLPIEPKFEQYSTVTV